MVSYYQHVHVADPSRVRYSDAPNFADTDSPVHYIWSYANFRNKDFFEVSSETPIDAPDDRVPSYIYERWQPGLQLASLLLERAQHFLERVMFAPTVHPTLDDPFPVPALSDEWKATPASSLAFEGELRELSKDYRIYRCPTEHPTQPGKDFCGVTDIRASGTGRRVIIYSAIHNVMFDHVGRYYFDQVPVDEQQNSFLVFAVTLVHELAHAINFKRYLDCINLRGISGLPVGSLEPAYRRHEVLRELGLRLEIDLFGGEIQVPHALDSTGKYLPITDGSQGLEISVYDQERGEMSRRYRLAKATVGSLFQQHNFSSTISSMHKVS